jgi:hypothetical protein
MDQLLLPFFPENSKKPSLNPKDADTWNKKEMLSWMPYLEKNPKKMYKTMK